MSNQKTLTKMKMMRTVRIIGAMNTQKRRAVKRMKIPEVSGSLDGVRAKTDVMA